MLSNSETILTKNNFLLSKGEIMDDLLKQLNECTKESLKKIEKELQIYGCTHPEKTSTMIDIYFVKKAIVRLELRIIAYLLSAILFLSFLMAIGFGWIKF